MGGEGFLRQMEGKAALVDSGSGYHIHVGQGGIYLGGLPNVSVGARHKHLSKVTAGPNVRDALIKGNREGFVLAVETGPESS